MAKRYVFKHAFIHDGKNFDKGAVCPDKIVAFAEPLGLLVEDGAPIEDKKSINPMPPQKVTKNQENKE